MNVDEIKNCLVVLSADERSEVAAFLYPSCAALLILNTSSESRQRLETNARTNWLSPEEFEKRLDLR